MKTSIKLCIVGWVFLILSFIRLTDYFFIYSAVFFAASFVTMEIEELNGKNKL